VSYRSRVNFPEDVQPDKSRDPTPQQVEEFQRKGIPLMAFLGLACSLAGLWLVYYGRSVATAVTILGVLGIVLSGVGWGYATMRHRPAGLAVAGVLLGVALIVYVS
jgi:hypothetical protein